MNSFVSKNELLKSIVPGGGNLLGSPANNSTVKFQFASSIATAASNSTPGALTFAADSSGNAAIYAQGTLVSSKIQNVVAAAATGAKHGGKTVTVTYIGDAGSIQTSTFNVIDEAGLEAYFALSKTIQLNTSTYEVKVDGATILVDDTNGLKSGLNIAYIEESGTTGATIALRDNSNNVLSSINVSDIVGDGVLKDSIYNKDNNTLELRFGNGKTYSASDPSTYTAVTIDLAELIDINDVFIGTASQDFLSATNDGSVLTLNTKMGVVSYTAADGQTPATLTGTTGLVDASQAIPVIKNYIDNANTDLHVEGEGDDTYINLEQDANNNKKLNASAFVNELTYAAGTDDATPATLTGLAGLVDGSQVATAISNFVNQRLIQKVATLDASVDSTGTTFVEVGVAEVDGKITNVVVTETVGSITGTASDLTGQAGLIDGADTATAVKTYVDGQIATLDASVDSTGTTFVEVGVAEVDGKITNVVVTEHNGTITGTASSLSGTAGIADAAATASAVKTYVDGQIATLDASLTADTTTHDISVYLEEVDGIVTTIGVEHTAATVTYTAAGEGTDANLTGSGSFVMANDIATIKQYVDAVVESGYSELDSQVVESDASSYVTVTTGIVDGKLLDASCAVAVVYTALTVDPGAVTVNTNGIATGNDVKTAVEGALTWTVLS